MQWTLADLDGIQIAVDLTELDIRTYSHDSIAVPSGHDDSAHEDHVGLRRPIVLLLFVYESSVSLSRWRILSRERTLVAR